MLGWAALTLDHNPEQRAELAADFSLIPNCVEELLRYEAPSPVQSRWCTADVEVHGGTIPARSKVVMITGSAGRDERAYPDADRFDIHREFDHHLSFGYGIHFCLGRRARPDGRTHRAGGDLQAFPRVVRGHGEGRAALHQYGPRLHQAADQRLIRASPPTGRPRLSCTLIDSPGARSSTD